MHAQTFIAMPV